MKKLLITNVSVIWFHGYIGYIRNIILTCILKYNISDVKINENYENIKKKTPTKYIRSKNRYFKVIFLYIKLI